MGKGGLEPLLNSPGKTVVSVSGGAECGAVGADSSGIDAELQAIIDIWPMLPKADRRAVLAIVREAGHEC